MAVSVSLINMKGGVGKTTLAAQLALAAATRELKTLAIDLDPQANLSQFLLGPKKYAEHLREEKPTILHVFDQFFPPSKRSASPRRAILHADTMKNFHSGIVQMARFGWVHLIPSQLELAHVLEDAPKGLERRLAQALAKVAPHYQLILIDCPPTESILTKAAYHASRYVLVPVRPEYLATIGFPMLARSIQIFKDKNARHALDVCGVVFNHSSYKVGPEGRTSMAEVREEARKNDWRVFENEVHYSTSYPKSAREGRPIGSTSNVKPYRSPQFSRFVDEFLGAIDLLPSRPAFDPNPHPIEF